MIGVIYSKFWNQLMKLYIKMIIHFVSLRVEMIGVIHSNF